MEHVGDPHVEEVADGDEVEHPAVQTRLEEPIFVLRKTDVVKPADHPLVVQKSGHVQLKHNKELFREDKSNQLASNLLLFLKQLCMNSLKLHFNCFKVNWFLISFQKICESESYAHFYFSNRVIGMR